MNPVYWIDPLGLDAKSDGGYTFPTFIPIPPSQTESGWDIEYTWDLPFEVPHLCLKGMCIPNPMMNEKSKPDREQKPDNCPTGTKPVDKDKRLDRGKIHDIKRQLGAAPKDWVGIDRDGNIWTNEGGEATNNGPFTDYIN